MTKQAFIIHAHGTVDQVCETREDAMREQRELFDLTGVKHKLTVVPWDEQDVAIARIDLKG